VKDDSAFAFHFPCDFAVRGFALGSKSQIRLESPGKPGSGGGFKMGSGLVLIRAWISGGDLCRIPLKFIQRLPRRTWILKTWAKLFWPSLLQPETEMEASHTFTT